MVIFLTMRHTHRKACGINNARSQNLPGNFQVLVIPFTRICSELLRQSTLSDAGQDGLYRISIALLVQLLNLFAPLILFGRSRKSLPRKEFYSAEVSNAHVFRSVDSYSFV